MFFVYEFEYVKKQLWLSELRKTYSFAYTMNVLYYISIILYF